MEVKITAEKVTWRGGEAFRGDVVELPQNVADYYLTNGYAVLPEAEKATEPEPIVAKVKRKYTRKKKAD